LEPGYGHPLLVEMVEMLWTPIIYDYGGGYIVDTHYPVEWLKLHIAAEIKVIQWVSINF
jgi:hypothetical protein